ncbi:MAG TPA: PHP domain-containing protein [Planctomycetota bacterium]|nr:PHP domain-containing protein [Planctomycetota bacterium]
MAKDVFADLHSHTLASDGEWTPRQLVDAAADAGLQALAVTDHDTVDSVAQAIDVGKARGIEIIPGCELTVYEQNTELHMLALFIDPDAPAFSDLLRNMQHHRRERALAMGARLRAAGFAIDDADIIEAAGSAVSLGRPHVAAALVKRGHARTIYGAMLHFLVEGKPGFIAKYKLSAEDAFRAVHASGGVALLAHPGIAPHDELIAPLFRRGMDGVEAVYPSHSEVNERFYKGLAGRYEKLICGGSDFHGPIVRPDRVLGMSGVSRSTLEALRRKADYYRTRNAALSGHI